MEATQKVTPKWQNPHLVRKWQRLDALRKGEQRPKKNWSKPGAFYDGNLLFSKRLGKEVAPNAGWIKREVERRLLEWDLLPIGERIKRMKEFSHALGNVQRYGTGKFRFLSVTPPGMETKPIKKDLDRRIGEAENTLKDTESIFKQWNIKLRKLGIRAEDISYPHGATLECNQCGTFVPKVQCLFTAPAVREWHKKLSPEKWQMHKHGYVDRSLEKRLRDMGTFGIGLISERDEERQKIKMIEMIQPIGMYRIDKKSRKTLGKEGTRREIPLKHPELLMLKLMLEKYSKEVKDAVHLTIPEGAVMSPFLGRGSKFKIETEEELDAMRKESPITKLYERVGALSGGKVTLDEGFDAYVFNRRKPLLSRIRPFLSRIRTLHGGGVGT